MPDAAPIITRRIHVLGDREEGDASARVLTLASVKGGVGRTTLSVNLAGLMALTGRSILLIDLDPLGGATAALGLPRQDCEGRMPTLCKPRILLDTLISAPQLPSLRVWPGGAGLNEVEARLWNLPEPKRDLSLEAGLEVARGLFDLIIVDAPPGHGPLSRNALACADDVLIPVPGHAFDCVSIERTMSLVRDSRPEGAPMPRVFCARVGETPEFSVDDLSGTCRSQVQLLQRRVVDDEGACAKAAEAGEILLRYDPSARVTRSLVELCRELMGQVFAEEAAPSS